MKIAMTASAHTSPAGVMKNRPNTEITGRFRT